MKFRSALLAPLAAALLSACGNLQNLKVAEVPPPLKSTPVALSPQRPPQKVSPGAIEVPERSVFIKQTAGGSVATVLLFGPLGALANAANIERRSKNLAESSTASSLLQLDALEEATAAWNEKPTQADPHALQLRPYVVVYPDDDRKNVTLIGGVFVTSSYALEGGNVWNADYHYVLPSAREFTVLERPMAPGQLASFKDELREGFRQIRTTVLRDLSPEPVNRPVGMIWAQALKASQMGFAGFTLGDLEIDPSGKLVMRSNMGNFGGLMAEGSKDTPHQVWIFPSATQYRLDREPQMRKAN